MIRCSTSGFSGRSFSISAFSRFSSASMSSNCMANNTTAKLPKTASPRGHDDPQGDAGSGSQDMGAALRVAGWPAKERKPSNPCRHISRRSCRGINQPGHVRVILEYVLEDLRAFQLIEVGRID